MPFLSNPGFLAVAFMEGSAAFILLVLYWLLAPDFPARFFRYWLGGWCVYTALEGLRILSLWRDGPYNPRFSFELSLVAAALFFAAVLECCGQGKRLKYLWPLGVMVASGIVALGILAKQPEWTRWAGSLAECALYLGAGLILWRTRSRHSGVGWMLLSGSFLLRGLHGLDRPAWTGQAFGLFSISFEGFFAIAMGISMVVLVLEASRARNEDLNEKLRRLALITAEATRSFRVDETLLEALHHLTGSLGASHGLVYLLDDPRDPSALVLRASVGFSESYRKQYARVPSSEAWVQRVLAQETPLVADRTERDAVVRRWMDLEKLTAIVQIRIPGEKTPLGLLGIGTTVPRTFEGDEEHFLVNVANLLGLTIRNVALFESAAISRRQWADTFDSIDDVILVHSPDGRVLRVNRALAGRLHVEPATLVGRKVWDVLRQGDTPWMLCPYCEGVGGKAEAIDPSFGGYFLASDSVYHDTEGGLLGTIHVLKDFTSRRLAENKFRNLFENTLEGVFTAAPDDRFVDFNNAFMRILGYDDRKELLEAEIASLYVDQADRLRLKRLLNEYGEVAGFQFQFRRRDGEIRTARESGFVTRDSAGAIVAYQGFLLDITELTQAERDVRQRNRELLALNGIAEDLSQSATLEGGLAGALVRVMELLGADVAALHFLDENGRALKPSVAMGYGSEDSRHAPPAEVSSAWLQQLRQTHATALSGSDPALPQGLRDIQRQEGIEASQVAVLWSKNRFMGTLLIGWRELREFSAAEGNLLGAVGNQIAATVDKSQLFDETREAYENLRRTQEQLLQSEKMAAVGQLISGVAHELNNPLTAILGYSQLLKSEEMTHPRGADYVEKLHKQAQRTQRIVESLLSFARQHKPERTAVDINEILEDTLVLREYDMKLNNIHVHRTFDSRLPLTSGDSHQLQQVFLNILNNAVDAVQEKGQSGEIWISTQQTEKLLRVEFTDSGAGVQNPTRIFDPFYTTKPVGKGTGLGLSICYGIVKEHGGEIQVRNSPPRGATFTVVLPIQPVARLPRAGETLRATASAVGKVLLVDDEEAVLHLEQEILQAHGVAVATARSPQEAIELLKRESVDAAVMDMKMPGEISTTALFGWIEENRPELAMRMIFTASDAAGAEAACMLQKSGCPLLPKPFHIEDFWNAVHKVLTADVSSLQRR
ncbi:MAG: ATP-binding protein [Candidatus Acidiferrales bacterium]